MRNWRAAIPAAVAAAAFLVLCGLGYWQVQRLYWKEALIASVAARMNMPPASLAEIEADYAVAGDVDYRPVILSGRFEHAGEVHFFTTSKGQVGWDVFTPLRLPDGRAVFVNRGFVPDALRSPETRAAGQAEGETAVTGLARNPLASKPNSFMPDNNVAERSFYWRSLPEMARAAGLPAQTLLPFYVDAGPAPNPGGWPQGGTTIVAFPNNHLGYAITWFGLAAALAGVAVAMLWRNVKPQR